jgi:two-component system, chemotaxis family, response regulator PixH
MFKILVVDDTQAMLDLACQYLNRAGYITHTANNGQEAIELIRLHKPDAIVTDWMMPVMGGLDLCRHLKRSPETASIPVIACSAKNRDVDRVWAIKQGVNVYLTKPYEASDLIDAIRQALGHQMV